MSEKIKQRAEILVGDVTMGGHEPTPEERARLEGRQENGVPRGLTKCHVCGEWKGECLRNLVIRVQCRCDANDRCRRCGTSLYHHAIGSNYYIEANDSVHHVPYFMAMKHQSGCPARDSDAGPQPSSQSQSSTASVQTRPPLTPRRMLEIAAMDLTMLEEFTYEELYERGYEAHGREDGSYGVFDPAKQRLLTPTEIEQLPVDVQDIIRRIRRFGDDLR